MAAGYTYPKGLFKIKAGFTKPSPNDKAVMGVNNDLHGGLKVVNSVTEMLAIHPNYLQYDYSACLVAHGDNNKSALYLLTRTPSLATGTVLEDWILVDIDKTISNGLVFKGLFDPGNYSLTDGDANNEVGDFYIVDCAEEVTITNLQLFGGQTKAVNRNDWIIYNGTMFEHLDRTTELVVTWETLTGVPQAIRDIADGGVTGDHTHSSSQVLCNILVNGTTYQMLSDLFGVILFSNRIASSVIAAQDTQLLTYAQLKQKFIDSTALSTAVETEVAASLSNVMQKYTMGDGDYLKPAVFDNDGGVIPAPSYMVFDEFSSGALVADTLKTVYHNKNFVNGKYFIMAREADNSNMVLMQILKPSDENGAMAVDIVSSIDLSSGVIIQVMGMATPVSID